MKTTSSLRALCNNLCVAFAVPGGGGGPVSYELAKLHHQFGVDDHDDVVTQLIVCKRPQKYTKIITIIP